MKAILNVILVLENLISAYMVIPFSVEYLFKFGHFGYNSNPYSDHTALVKHYDIVNHIDFVMVIFPITIIYSISFLALNKGNKLASIFGFTSLLLQVICFGVILCIPV